MRILLLISVLFLSGCLKHRHVISKDEQQLAIISCMYGSLDAQQQMMIRDGTASLGKGYAEKSCQYLLTILKQDNDLE